MARKQKTSKGEMKETPSDQVIIENATIQDALDYFQISREDVRGVYEFLDKIVLSLVDGRKLVVFKQKPE